MTDNPALISNACQTFPREAPEHARAWGEMVQALARARAETCATWRCLRRWILRPAYPTV